MASRPLLLPSALWAALSLLAACTVAPSPPPREAPPAAATPPRLPGPFSTAAPRRADDVTALNATCEGCHAEIAQEWRASQHRISFTDPFFQRALLIEPMPFCRGCHAPEADPRGAPPAPLAALGVGCVTCHVTSPGAVLGAAKDHPPSPGAGSCSLPITRDARFSTAAACASCHEFNFPDEGLRPTPEKMQSTVSEHMSSPYAAVSCATCHMPAVKGPSGEHRSHAFASSEDTARVRTAVSVKAQRGPGGSLRIALDANGVGHAFPTGDLFRRLEVSVEAVGPEEQVVASARRYLTRHFGYARSSGVLVKKLVSDDRVAAGAARVVDVDLGPAAARAKLVYRVSYQRVEHPQSVNSDDALVGSEVVIAEGTLPPAP